MIRSVLIIAVLLGLAFGLTAQQRTQTTPSNQPTQKPAPDEDDVVRITTNLVQVDAVVTDGKGRLVTDLRADELEIQEDGKAREITNFSFIELEARPEISAQPANSNVPSPSPLRLKPEQVRRTIAVIVDDLGLSFDSIHQTRSALKKFVDQAQPDDLVAIIRTGGGVGALQQFTSDKRQLYAAIERIKWYPIGRGGVTAFAPISNSNLSESEGANITVDAFRDEVLTVGTLGAIQYVIRGLNELPGRKSVILLADGLHIFDRRDLTRGSRMVDAARRLTEVANRASVVIYTVDVRGLQTLSLTAADSIAGLSGPALQNTLSARSEYMRDSQDGLIYLAEQTGGFAVRNSNDISGGIRRVVDDQKGYYLIGYRPDPSTFDGVDARRKFHKLSLKVLRPGKFDVRIRRGFFGIPDERLTPQPATRQQKMITALTSPFGSEGVQLRLTSLFANDAKAGSVLRSYLHIKSNDLTFTDEPDGWHKASFDILAVTFGDNGVPIDQLNRTHTVRIKGETYRRALKDGLTYHLLVPVKKAGAYQLRIALRDISSDRVGSATQFVEVPDVSKNRLMLSGVLVMATPLHVFQKQIGKTPTQPATEDNDADGQANTVLRRFRRNYVLQYAFAIYNAQLDKTTRLPKLLTQIRLIRDGKQVFGGKELPYDATDQTDPKRLTAGGAIQLGSEMQPGEYVLQVVVTDTLAKAKNRLTTQWIDFEIVE